MFTNASFSLFLCNYNSNTIITNKYVSKQKNKQPPNKQPPLQKITLLVFFPVEPWIQN